MTMPGFTAQASLGRVSGTYHRGTQPIPPGGRIQPALSILDVIRLGRFHLCLWEICYNLPDGTGRTIRVCHCAD